MVADISFTLTRSFYNNHVRNSPIWIYVPERMQLISECLIFDLITTVVDTFLHTWIRQ